MKLTLVACEEAGVPIQLVVHDEFDWSWENPSELKTVKQLQLETMKFNVPMYVDQEIGPNWGELEKIAA
jgi:hypothetical protein